MLKTTSIRKYGKGPWQVALLHGGPGAAGEMQQVAERLSDDFGILECLQTEHSVRGQLKELHDQLYLEADLPVTLVGYSWGAWLGLLYAGGFPENLKKLILISAAPFESKYSKNIMQVRLQRLNFPERAEAERLIALLSSDHADNPSFMRLAELLSSADAFDPISASNENNNFSIEIYKSVWKEASAMREKGELLRSAAKITCPVVAIHGDYDPHPAMAVQKPLSEILDNFRMILLENCGHAPWKEKQAAENFYNILREEIFTSEKDHF